jgi:two-component system, OmpR family, response regulator QseB
MRILLVEDDASLGAGLQTGLMQSGYAVDWVRDGAKALLALSNPAEIFAAVVLDIGLPLYSGMEVLRATRLSGNKVPILILTARDTLDDKVAGLDAGADDYLLKPFDLEELRARLRALVRRGEGQLNTVLEYEDLILDCSAHSLTVDGASVTLTQREFALLELLLIRTGRVVTRNDIEAHLHGRQAETDSNVLDVHISTLRRKIGSEVIQTVRGIGYIVGKKE